MAVAPADHARLDGRVRQDSDSLASRHAWVDDLDTKLADLEAAFHAEADSLPQPNIAPLTMEALFDLEKAPDATPETLSVEPAPTVASDLLDPAPEAVPEPDRPSALLTSEPPPVLSAPEPPAFGRQRTPAPSEPDAVTEPVNLNPPTPARLSRNQLVARSFRAMLASEIRAQEEAASVAAAQEPVIVTTHHVAHEVDGKNGVVRLEIDPSSTGGARVTIIISKASS